jgi:hypothetical protein
VADNKMSNTNNEKTAFERIHQLALKELEKSALPQETKVALEEIVALARYKFDVRASKT